MGFVLCLGMIVHHLQYNARIMIPSLTADRLWATSILDAIVRDPFTAPLPSTRQQEVAVVQMLLREGINAVQTSERSTLYVSRLSKEARLAFTSILMGMSGDRPLHQMNLALGAPVWGIHQTNLGVLAPGPREEVRRVTSAAVMAFGFTVSEPPQEPEAGTPEALTPEHPGQALPCAGGRDFNMATSPPPPPLWP